MTTKDYITKLNKAERAINGKRFVGLSSRLAVSSLNGCFKKV